MNVITAKKRSLRGSFRPAAAAAEPAAPYAGARSWSSTSAGDAGIADIVGQASTAGVSLVAGTSLIVGEGTANREIFYLHANGDDLHVLPAATPFGRFPPDAVAGFNGASPTGPWVTSVGGASSLSVVDGAVVFTSPAGGGRLTATAGSRSYPRVLVVMEGLKALSISADDRAQLIISSNATNRYSTMLIRSNKWFLYPNPGDTGLNALTARTLELALDGTGNLVHYRFGRSGAWSSGAPASAPFAAGDFRVDIKDFASADSIEMSSCYVAGYLT